jgi:hypothetical protein
LDEEAETRRDQSMGSGLSVESARRLKMLGADAVIVQSQEAGGHVKSDLGVRRYETGDIQARRSAADRTRRKLRVAPV